MHYGDLVDTSNLNRLLEKIEPHEIYNLAAQSHVKVSFEVADYTAQVDALGTLRFLDALKESGLRNTRFYQASTSELFGKVQAIPQNEETPFYPRSPYGVAKLYAYWIIVNYREAYGLFASNGILFNHESPRRGETFITKKITRAIARIVCGLQTKLIVGNLDAKRDWGYAPEYCEGMWRMLQYSRPEDFVLATGESHSVREFIEKAFSHLGIKIAWYGKAETEVGIVDEINKNVHVDSDDAVNLDKLEIGETIVAVSPQYYRPTEVDILLGDASKAKRVLGWYPKVKFDELVKIMLDYDIKKSLQEVYSNGYKNRNKEMAAI